MPLVNNLQTKEPDQDPVLLNLPNKIENYSTSNRTDEFTGLPNQLPVLRSIYNQVIDADPNHTAEIIRAANQIGESNSFVANNWDVVKKMSNMPSLQDWAEYERLFPSTTRFLSDPKNMATAKDLTPELGHLEKGFKGTLNQLDQWTWDQLKGVWGGIEQFPAAMKLQLGNVTQALLLYSRQQIKNHLGGFDPFVPGQYDSANPNQILPESIQQHIVEERQGQGFNTLTGDNVTREDLYRGPGVYERRQLQNEFGTLEYGQKISAEAQQRISEINKSLGISPGHGQFAYDVTSGLLNMAPVLALTAVSGTPAPMIAYFGYTGAADTYVNLYNQGVPPDQVLQMAEANGVIDAALAVIPAETFLESILNPSKTVVSSILRQSFSMGSMTSMAEALKIGIENGVIDKKTPWAEALQRVGYSFATGFTMGGITGVSGHVMGNLMHFRKTESDVNRYQQIGEAAKNSQYMERIPESFRELADNHAAEYNMKDIYVDAKPFVELLQSSVPDMTREKAIQIISDEFGLGDQVKTALDIGGSIRVPYGEWIQKTAKTPLYDQLKGDVKFSEDGFTFNQAQAETERIQTQIEQAQKEAETKAAANEIQKTNYDLIYQDIKDKLTAAGRPEKISPMEFPKWVDYNSRLWASRMVTEASRRGVNAMELYQGINNPEIASDVKTSIPKNTQTDPSKTLPTQNSVDLKSDPFGLPKEEVQKYISDTMGRVRSATAGSIKIGDIVVDYQTGNFGNVEKIYSNGQFRVKDRENGNIKLVTDSSSTWLKWDDLYDAYSGQTFNQMSKSELQKLQSQLSSMIGPRPEMSPESAKIADQILNVIRQQKELKGQTFNQDESNPRAQVNISDNKAVVSLFQSADQSSFIHESSHIWLQDTWDYIKSGQADEHYQADWKTLSDWLDIKDGQEALTTDQQEKFARNFESYLMEGKAPSTGLQKAFSAFRRWLVKIYRNIKGTSELTDPVRQVMDRMLATEDEIAQAEISWGYDDVIDTSKLDPAVAKRLQEYQERAHEQAVEILLNKQMKETQKEHREFLKNERARITQQTLEEVNAEPLYMAMDSLRKGVDGRYNKDVKETALMYREGKLVGLSRNQFENIAEENGFSCGDELAQLALAAAYRKDEVNARVARHMNQFADLRNTPQLSEEAIRAIHNESRLELIALEKGIFQSLIGKAEVSSGVRRLNTERARAESEMATKAARDIFYRKSYKESGNPATYFGNEKRAALNAQKALLDGKYEEAANFKNMQMLNHALAMEALKNGKEVDKVFNYFNKFQKRGANLLGMPEDFTHQIDTLLERFGLEEKRFLIEPGRETISEFAKRMEDEYHPISLPESLLNEAYQKPYEDFTLGELRDLYQGIKVLENLGKNYKRFLSDFIKADLEASAQETSQSIVHNVGEPYLADKGIGTNIKGKFEKLFQTIHRLPDAAIPWLVRAETLCRYLDGEKDAGPMQRYLYQLFSFAWNEKQKMTEKAVGDIRDLFGKYYLPKELAGIREEKTFFPEINRYLTKEEIIATALNWGNEGNRDRIRRGFRLGDEQIMNILDTLDKKDWDMVQDIWDYLDSYWPEVRKLEVEVAGLEPEKVEATEIQTKHGNYKGGYYPLAYDFEKSSEAAKTEEQKNALYKQYSTVHAHTEHGHTKERVTKLERPVRLSFDVLTNHLVNVIHDLTHRRAVIDANRFLKQKAVRESIENAVGVKGYRSLEEWVKSIAQDQSEYLNTGDKIARWMRHGVTFSAMAVNLPMFTVDLTGNFWLGAWERGLVPELKSIYNFATHVKENRELIHSKSEFMKERAVVRDRDLYDVSRRMFDNDIGLYSFAFRLMAWSDEAIAYPTWLASFREGLTKFAGDERQATEYADGVIRRSFGSGAKKDLSGAQRGSEVRKIVTMFYSWSNMMFNRYWAAYKKVGHDWEEGRKAAAIETISRAVFYGWIIPGISEFMIREAIRNRQNDDEDEKKKRFITSLFRGPMGTVPLVRDVGAFLLDNAVGITGDYKLSSIESMVNDFGRTVSAARKVWTTGEGTDKLVEQSARSASYLVPYPQQINTWAFNFLDWLRNDGESSWRDIFQRRK